MKQIGLCKFCQNTKAFCKAHIIPQGFVKPFPGQTPVLVETDNEKITPVRNNGYFDENILCSECDNKIGKFEDKRIDFFRNRNDSDYNYRDISLAIKAILWKAHITTNPAFKEIDLGRKYGDALYDNLRACIDDEKSIVPQDVFIWIGRYSIKLNQDPILGNRVMWTKGKEPSTKSTIYVFDIGGHKISIKVGGKKFPPHSLSPIDQISANIEEIN